MFVFLDCGNFLTNLPFTDRTSLLQNSSERMNTSTVSKGFAVLLSIVALVASFAPLSVQAEVTCTSSSQTIVSDTSSGVEGIGASFATYSSSPLWTTIPGAVWVWKSPLVESPSTNETILLKREFALDGTVSNAAITIAADDYYKVFVNDTLVASEFGEGNFITTKTFVIPGSLFKTNNTLSVEVTNAAYFSPADATPYNNPGGVIFSLSIDSSKCSGSTTPPSEGSTGGGYYTGPGTPSGTTGDTSGGTGGTEGTTETGTPKSSAVQTALGGALIVNASTNDSASTTDASTTEAITDNTNLLAAATEAVPSTLAEILNCSLIALIALIVLYIVWTLFAGENHEEGLTTRKLIFFLVAGALSILILGVSSLACAIVPFVILLALLLGTIYFKVL